MKTTNCEQPATHLAEAGEARPHLVLGTASRLLEGLGLKGLGLGFGV